MQHQCLEILTLELSGVKLLKIKLMLVDIHQEQLTVIIFQVFPQMVELRFLEMIGKLQLIVF